jgi:hypothetical protein
MSDSTATPAVSDDFDFDSFIESKKVERNDYDGAFRIAIKALNDTATLKGYVVKPADLKRDTAYVAGSAHKALKAMLDASPHAAKYDCKKGKVTAGAVVVFTRKPVAPATK